MLERKTLSNDLVKLIPMIKNDFEWVFAAASDPEIWAQHPDSNRYTPVGFTRYFQKLIDTDIPYLIIDSKTEQVIGATSFYHYDRNEKSIAIGYTFLAKEYWGGEYNQSVKNLMMDFAFEKLDKVIFHVASENTRSQKALEKINAVKESEFDENGSLKFTYAIYKNNR